MKGLLKNNFYASFANIKWFTGVMLLLGILVLIMGNKIPSLLINYTLICMAGFSFNTVSSMGKENSAKWEKYKLTFPVTRADIIKSHYVNHLAGIFTGLLFAGSFAGLSALLHGFSFDKSTDLLMLFVTGIAISLLLGAIFFPLYYLAGEERKEAITITCMLLAIIIFSGLIALTNYLFAPMDSLQLVITAVFLAVICSCLFAISYPLTVRIFRKKEY